MSITRIIYRFYPVVELGSATALALIDTRLFLVYALWRVLSHLNYIRATLAVYETNAFVDSSLLLRHAGVDEDDLVAARNNFMEKLDADSLAFLRRDFKISLGVVPDWLAHGTAATRVRDVVNDS